MKKILLFLAVFCCFFQISAVYAGRLENRAFKTPESVSKSKHSLVSYLTQNVEDDYDKLKVIAYWIASHIAYDGYKYDLKNGLNEKEAKLKYDILAKKSGICGDFAQLFADMANIAHAGRVSVVTGYVLENVSHIKRFYNERDVRGEDGHAWNKVELSDGRKFFVDTTFMTSANIKESNKRGSSLRHKLDLNKRGRAHEVNTNVDSYYFDFTPKKEVRERGMLHLQRKYIR